MYKKYLVAFPCYNKNNIDTILECIKNIKLYLPNAKIVIVDSDSYDKTYFNIINNLYSDIDIHDIKNKSYTFGCIWHVYENYKDYEFYYFIHDSVIIKENLEYLSLKDLVIPIYARSGFWLGKNTNIKYPNYGFKRKDEISFILNNYKKYSSEEFQYSIPQYFNLVVGEIMFINRKILDILYKYNYNKMVPLTKHEASGHERSWGIVFEKLGYDIEKHSLCGDLFNLPDYSKFEKMYLSRK